MMRPAPIGYVFGTCPACTTPQHMLLRLYPERATVDDGTPYDLIAAAPTIEAILAAARLLTSDMVNCKPGTLPNDIGDLESLLRNGLRVQMRPAAR